MDIQQPVRQFPFKRVLQGIAGILILLVAAGALFHFKTPVIRANSIEIFRNEISSNAPIKVTFDQLMDRSSVEAEFKILPHVPGRFEWTLNTVTFFPEERFKVGEDYSMTIPETVKNIFGRPLGKDYISYFTVVDPPKVSLAVPNDETAVDSKITVMFDRPMTELTTYDVVESRDFPLKLDPSVDGRFKWIGTSAFQYIPKDRLAYSTSYTAAVPAGTPSLDNGKTVDAYTFTFRTPRIALIGELPQTISASTPFPLVFNQDVNLQSLAEHAVFKDANGAKVGVKFRWQKREEITYDDSGKEQKKEIEDKKIAEALPAKDDWGYDNGYKLEITKGINGVEGNLTVEKEVSFEFRTNKFLTSYSPDEFEDAASPSGNIVLYFDQEVDLGSVRNYFSVEPKVEFKVNYAKKCDPKWEPSESPDEKCAEIDNFSGVIFTPKQALKNVQKYTATLKKDVRAKNGIAYLKEDVKWVFTTADVFKILRSNPANNGTADYKRLCLFSNNFADPEEIAKQFVFSPKEKAKPVVSVYAVSLKEKLYGNCMPAALNEKIAIEINTLLDPEAKYKMTLKGTAKDSFDQILGSDFTVSFSTTPLKDEDTSLEILQRNFYAFSTLDQHAAPVFATANLSEFDLEICRMPAVKFLDIDTEYRRALAAYSRSQSKAAYPRYDAYGWNAFTPGDTNCLEYKSIKKKLKKVYWERQYSEIELASELGHEITPGYYYLRASSPRTYRMEYDYYSKQTSKVFVRPDQVLGITNMHVAVKTSRENVLFWATDLAKGQPLSGVSMRLFTESGEPIEGVTYTDKEGLSKRPLHDLPFEYALASKAGDEVIVSASFQDGISPWDYNLGYSRLDRYTQGYLYTDRPLYQPTHEVFFKGILRYDDDAVLRMPDAKTIQVEIYDSRGAEVYKKSHSISVQGTFGGSFKIDSKAPLGRYSIGTCFRPKTDWCEESGPSQSFFVEEYRKPEYKLEATFSKESYVDKEEMRALLDGQYFFGAPVPYGKVSWNILSQNYYFDEYKGEWFSFTDVDTFRKCYFGCPYSDETLASGEGKLDKDGKMLITHKIDLSSKDADGKIKPPDASKIYTLSATVQDKNNQSVAVNKSFIAHRGEFYVGIKNEEYIVQAGEKTPVKIITVDQKGIPVSGKTVDVELFKTEWKYVKKKNVDGGFYWDNELNQKSVDKTSLSTDSDGLAKYSFKVNEGGEYLVRATGRDSLGNTFSSSVDFYATTNEIVHWKQENNNRMELKLDKLTYETGDTAKVLIKSPYSNVKALLAYERGDIMETKIFDITSNAQVLEVPIVEKMIPNFYVSVLEVKGGDKKDPPDFKLGYTNVVVDAKKKELKIEIKPDKKRYQPAEKVKLEITTTDYSGAPVAADLSIAAVDASLLALKGNPKRDLLNVFYNNRLLGVMTTDNMTNFLERINLSDLKGAKGGSGKGEDEFGKPRGKFEDTAFWRSSLSTDANGKLTAEFTLPDNLTTWNIEAIGATANSQFGSANETVTTQKAVMVRPVLPRFALFGDKLQLGAIVHNFTDGDADFTLTIDAKNLTVSDKKTKTVFIPKEGSQKVLWETVVPKVKSGTPAQVTISAKGKGADDAVIQEFPIYSFSTPETVAMSSYTDDVSFTEKVLLPESIDPEFGELKLTTGATLATYISDSLNYLLGYPYGCTEQIISRIVPNIIVRNAVSLPNLKDKIKLDPITDDKGKIIDFDTLVQTSLQRIYEFQRDDGGFGYFFPAKESYPYLTAYVVFGLDKIKKAGYSVGERNLNRAISYLQDHMRDNRDLKDSYTGKLRQKDSYWANNRAYMLFVMSEASRGDIGLSNSLYDDRELLSNSGKAYLAMTLNNLSQSASKVQKLLQTLENNSRIEPRGTYVRNDAGNYFDMMTNTKTTALALQAFNRIDPQNPLIPKIIKWLIGVRKDGRWDTTQDNVAALIALTEVLEKNKETEAKYDAKISIDGKIVSKYSVNSENILDQQTITRAISDLKLGGGGNDVIFTKDGNGRLYYDMVLRYFLPVDEIKPRSEGFNIERNYYRLDDSKMEHPVNDPKAGETLRGHLTIVVPEERRLVAVENFLPAGFELVNFEFATADQGLRKNQSANDYDCYECAVDYGEFYESAAAPLYSGYYFGYSPWSFKELRTDRLFLFADRLSKGVYEYDYYVQVTSEGKFHHQPAIVSEMYFPENFGRTKGEWMTVKSN